MYTYMHIICIFCIRKYLYIYEYEFKFIAYICRVSKQCNFLKKI